MSNKMRGFLRWLKQVTSRPMHGSTLDLSKAGPDWTGWTFGPYGRAASYRLVTPNGEALAACEIASARADRRDISYLQMRVRQLSH